MDSGKENCVHFVEFVELPWDAGDTAKWAFDLVPPPATWHSHDPRPAAIVQSQKELLMSFDWQADNVLRMPKNARVEHSPTEHAGGECFSLFVDGNICVVIRFGQSPPWLASFIDYLCKDAFPTLTVQDWVTILGIPPSAFLATLNVLLKSGFVLRSERKLVQSHRALAERWQPTDGGISNCRNTARLGLGR